MMMIQASQNFDKQIIRVFLRQGNPVVF